MKTTKYVSHGICEKPQRMEYNVIKDQHFTYIGKVVHSHETLMIMIRDIMFTNHIGQIHKDIIQYDQNNKKLIQMFRKWLIERTEVKVHPTIDLLCNKLIQSTDFRNHFVHGLPIVVPLNRKLELGIKFIVHKSNDKGEVRSDSVTFSFADIETYLTGNHYLYFEFVRMLATKTVDLIESEFIKGSEKIIFLIEMKDLKKCIFLFRPIPDIFTE